MLENSLPPPKLRELRARLRVEKLEVRGTPGSLWGDAVSAAVFGVALTESTSVLGDFSVVGTSKSETASEASAKSEPEAKSDGLPRALFLDVPTPSEQRRSTPPQTAGVTGTAAITSVDNLFLYSGDAFDTPTATSAKTSPLTTNQTDAVGPTAKDGVPLAVNTPPVEVAEPAIGPIPEFAAVEPQGTPITPKSSLPPPPPIGGSGVMTMSMTSGASVVISEIYGGGNTSSNPPYSRDFIELHNRGTTTINLSGWSVQYSAALGSSWQVTALSGTIDPGEYFLVGESSVAGPQGAALPSVDVQGTINMSQSAGKVALVSSTTALVGTASSGGSIVDFVGYGNANAYEGSAPAPQLTSQVSATRRVGGRQDTDQNSVDFSVDLPSPRNNAGQGVNRVPVAVNDALTLDEDAETATVDVVANDTDADADALTVTAVSAATNGWAEVGYDGVSVLYTPHWDFVGTDSFNYTIADGFGGTATATVNVTVNAVNDAPTNDVPGRQETHISTALTFSSTAGNSISVSDVDAGTANVRVDLSVTNGVLTLGGTTGLTFVSGSNGSSAMAFTGTITAINTALNGLQFTPVTAFEGEAVVTITTDDLGNSGSGGAQSTTDTVTIAVGTVVILEAFDPLAYEDVPDSAGFRFSRSGDLTGALTIHYELTGGTATHNTGTGGDYTLSTLGVVKPATGTLTILAGERSVWLNVDPIDDGITEVPETVEMTAKPGSGYALGAKRTGTAEIEDQSFGLDKTKGPTGTNHKAAQNRGVSGMGVKVGVIEPPETNQAGRIIGYAVDSKLALLGTRLIQNRNFLDDRPTIAPGNPTNPAGVEFKDEVVKSKHMSLVASVIAGDDTEGDFDGVAPKAEIYAGVINKTDAVRVAVDAFYHQGVRLFNFSLTSDATEATPFLDWIARQRDLLFVIGAGNSATVQNYVGMRQPANSYNGLVVGAVGSDFTTRAYYSEYLTKPEASARRARPLGPHSSDDRGLPHILAPGGEPASEISNGKLKYAGTSFAAPHVTGIAALLAERQKGDMRLGPGAAPGDEQAHLAYKAIIMNSARKRFINDPVNNPVVAGLALDHANTKTEPSDRDYLKIAGGKPALNDAANPDPTNGWTPSSWSLKDKMIGGVNVKEFIAISPLDDEQGTGIADADRALIQYHGGVPSGANPASGKAGPTNPVLAIGWNIATPVPPSGGGKPQHVYELSTPLAVGDMITATLIWDQTVLETEEPETGGPDNKIEAGDTYKVPDGENAEDKSNGIADYTLEILFRGEVVATSNSPARWQDRGDTLEHLHIPVPIAGEPSDYAIRVRLDASDGTTTTPPYALAWWAGAPAMP